MAHSSKSKKSRKRELSPPAKAHRASKCSRQESTLEVEDTGHSHSVVTKSALWSQGQSGKAPNVETANAAQRGQKSVIIDCDADDKSDSGDDGGAAKIDHSSEPEDSGVELGPCNLFSVHIDSNTSVERLSKDWNTPVYAFFKPTPQIGYADGRRYHSFKCAGQGCCKQIRRFLDKGDAKSTSNLYKHAKLCWGPEVVSDACQAKTASDARGSLAKLQANESITTIFERNRKEKMTYSHRQHNKTETKCVNHFLNASC
jgi:hypothetical protein